MPATSIDELVKRLHHPEMRRLSDDYFDGSVPDFNTAIFVAVDKSTIRAYHNTRRYRPLSIFRSWAFKELASSADNRIRLAARDIKSYSDFHDELCESLRSYWATVEEVVPKEMNAHASPVPNYGRARKLIDLLMKHVVLVSSQDIAVRTDLKRLIHVPLDKYTLKHLSGVSRLKGIAVPASKWTMGFVTEDTYSPLQSLVREICAEARVDPIDFDIYAWNAEHRHIAGISKSLNITDSQLDLIGRDQPQAKDMKWLGRRLRAQKIA